MNPLRRPRVPFLLGLLPLLPLLALTGPASRPPQALPHRLTLKLNGAPVPVDTAYSRIEVSQGAGKVLTLNLIRRDAPDDPGLTILVDEFKPVPAVYRFKEILSAHVTEATYRVGSEVAESQACGVNQGEVRVTAVDTKRQILTGTFRAVGCSTNAPRSGKKYTFEGSFRCAYELR
ncbi:hypothetical protein EJV47_09610 [Hymenobacter gummosus]|uniref:Uncharacterized protein n=1 Tax=Hymenobacter gummosus TaxID=1776032 RepID=A0A3S0JBG8_9BACT|nr:hypothetical protein [Hymenobacter gummosus]RTQ50863.1 hypothetical protein EJV47_09610 [Hymenobacter gummosus]